MNKLRIASIILITCLFFSTPAIAIQNLSVSSLSELADVYTGGGVGYNALADTDAAIVFTATGIYFYSYDADSAETEDGLKYITPDESSAGVPYAGDARWVLLSAYALNLNMTNIIGTGYIAMGADPGDSGAVRFSNNTALSWEPSTPGTDIFIALDSSDILQVGQNCADIRLGTSGTGNVTVTGDLTVTGADIIIGNVAATFGGATTDSVTITTDGTGDAEVVLPAGSVSATELASTLDLSGKTLTMPATVTATAADNPTIAFAETDGTDWWNGVDDTGNSMEWRTNTTVGNSVKMELTEAGALTILTDLTFNNNVSLIAELASIRSTMGTLGGGTATDFALSTDADAGDNDIQSIDKLEGIDATEYIDMGADGYVVVDAGTAINLDSSVQAGDGTYSWGHTPAFGIEGILEVDGKIYADGGATLAGLISVTNTLGIPNSDDPDVGTAGAIALDSDGWLRVYQNSLQKAIPLQHEVHVTCVKPQDMADAVRDAFEVWSNETGMSFVITGWKAWSGTDDTTLNIEEVDADGQNNATVDAVEIATNGTGCFYASDTTITGATIENGHRLLIDFDDTDDPAQVKLTIYGYFAADVN